MTTSLSELISLFLSLLVLAFAIYHYRVFSRPRYNLFFHALYWIVAGLVATVLEAVAVPEILNLIEHSAFTVSAILVALGCRRFMTAPGDE